MLIQKDYVLHIEMFSLTIYSSLQVKCSKGSLYDKLAGQRKLGQSLSSLSSYSNFLIFFHQTTSPENEHFFNSSSQRKYIILYQKDIVFLICFLLGGWSVHLGIAYMFLWHIWNCMSLLGRVYILEFLGVDSCPDHILKIKCFCKSLV